MASIQDRPNRLLLGTQASSSVSSRVCGLARKLTEKQVLQKWKHVMIKLWTVLELACTNRKVEAKLGKAAYKTC